VQYVFFVNSNHSGDNTVLLASITRYVFFVTPNHSHNGNMVKDKHAKAVAFMAKMQFNDSCIGYDAGAKKCKCLQKFLEKKVSLMDAKNYFSNISLQLWNGIGDDDDEDMMIQKVVDFLNPFHVVKNGKEIFLSFMCKRISLQ